MNFIQNGIRFLFDFGQKEGCIQIFNASIDQCIDIFFLIQFSDQIFFFFNLFFLRFYAAGIKKSKDVSKAIETTTVVGTEI